MDIAKRVEERKLRAQIQEKPVRVTAKKRDDLQQVMDLLRAEDFGSPLQYNDFRDRSRAGFCKSFNRACIFFHDRSPLALPTIRGKATENPFVSGG